MVMGELVGWGFGLWLLRGRFGDERDRELREGEG